MTRFIIPVLALIVSLVTAGPAAAGLVSLDDFTSPNANGTIATFGAVTLQRTVVGGSYIQNFGVAGTNDFTVTYTLSGGTFGDFVGDLNSAVHYSLGEFGNPDFSYTISAKEVGDADYTEFFSGSVNADPHVTTHVAPAFEDLDDVFEIQFAFTDNSFVFSPGDVVLFGGNFSAVPEPTSLALVGLAVGGLGLRRRRRS